MVHMHRIRKLCALITVTASSIALGGAAHADVPTTIASPDGGVAAPDGWFADFTQVHAGPDDGGSAVVIRDCAPTSASQRWERRGMALVNRDSGECATVVPRVVDGKPDRVLVAAECVLGDPQQQWLVLG